MSKLMRLAIGILLVSLFGIQGARGQGKGSISGHATDANHDALVGARVELQPSGRAVTTDAQGAFTIPDLDPGKYTLTITYVGFKTFSTDVTVAPGGVVSAEEALDIEAVNQQVIVRGERERGEIEALNREINADNIVQVLPAEVILSLPNTNIADAVGRLPSVSLERDEGEGKYVQIRGTEPRLTNLTIDGVHVPSPESVRQVKLDAIPADLVDSIEINKTLSPSQEGDAIGGSVNLVTKKAGERPFASFQTMGGYTPVGLGGRLNEVDSTVGRRFGTEHRLGLIFGGSYDYNQRGTDDIEPSPGTTSVAGNGDFADGVPVVFGMDVRQYTFYRHRYGFAGSGDYKLGQASLVYLRGFFSNFLDYGEDWIYSPSVGPFTSPTTTQANSGKVDYSHVMRRPEQRILNFIAGANHSLGKTFIAYEVALGQGRSVGGFFSSHFSGPSNVTYNLDTSNPHVPKFIQVGGDNIFDPANYALGGGNFNFFRTFSFGTQNHILERDLTGSIDVSRQYSVGSHFGALQVGFKVRDARKSSFFFERIFDTNPPFTSLAPLTAFVGSIKNPNPGYYFKNYQLLPLSDYGKIIAYYNANQGQFTEATDFEHQINDPNDYLTKERVTAGYIQNTLTVGHFKVLGGLRIEGTQGSFVGTQVIFDPNTRKFVQDLPAPGQQTYTSFLPSVQVQYNFNGTTNIRAAYGRGIARPNFADLPPSELFQPASQRVSLGNPSLKATHANDYDILFEHYLKSVGILEGGWFYKDLSDPIFQIQTFPTSGQLAGFQVRQPINGRKAHIQGVEFAWQQHFTFLPGVLKGFGVSANYSYTTSRAKFPIDPNTGRPTRVDSPALLRQAPNNWNFDATYDKGPISARMGLTHNDRSIFFYNYINPPPQDGSPAPGGLKGPNGDVYYYPHTQVDAQVSYRLPRAHGIHFIVSMLNLNNEVFGFYQGSEQFPIQREYYSRTIAGGLRWTSGSDIGK
jgi:TonB-dependent receptor